jgi:hypothetical protein
VSTLLTHHNHQQSHHKSSSDFITSPLVTSDSDHNIRIKNYQKLSSECESLRTTSSSPGHQTPCGEPELCSSSLQWETRQIKILKAATIDHIVKYILFLTGRQIELQSKHDQDNGGTGSSTDHCHSIVMDEERNNVSHVIHVLFIAYRLFTSPVQLFQLIHQTYVTHVTSQQVPHLTRQFNFVLLYWLNNYPEDFLNDPSEPPPKILHPLVPQPPPSPSSSSSHSFQSNSTDDCDESKTATESVTSGSSGNQSKVHEKNSGNQNRIRSNGAANGGHKFIDQLLSAPDLDESVHRKALVLLQDYKPDPCSPQSDNGLNGVSTLFLSDMPECICPAYCFLLFFTFSCYEKY